MRASSFIVVLSGLVAATSAARLFSRQYPDCANPCILNAQTGSCSADDLNCLCNSSEFISSTTQCIVSSCSADDARTAEAVARQFCEQVGVTLTETPSVIASATNSGSAAPSGSASQTSSAPASSGTSPSGSSSANAPAQTDSDNSGAVAHGVNALVGLAAVGLVALTL